MKMLSTVIYVLIGLVLLGFFQHLIRKRVPRYYREWGLRIPAIGYTIVLTISWFDYGAFSFGVTYIPPEEPSLLISLGRLNIYIDTIKVRN